MKNLLDPDSRFLEFCQTLTQYVLVNLLWLLCCLPLFTVGASTKALYAGVQAIRQSQTWTARTFFQDFRRNFLASTGVWLGIALVGAALAADFLILAQLSFPGRFVLLALAAFLSVGLVFFSAMAFPLLSRFPCTARACFVNGILLCLAHSPKLLLVSLTNLTPVLLFLLFPRLFVMSGFFWVLFGAAVIAGVNLHTLNPVFDALEHRENRPRKEEFR